MAILKCKMCGGDLHLIEGVSTAECEYCGSVQTVPQVDDEKKLTLFARAHRLRAECDFDKAAGLYEAIVADFPEEAEAYWGLVLCKYGIEYVDDPLSSRKIPTCHRFSFTSVLDDEDYQATLENAVVTARQIYEAEANQLEKIRRDILEISEKEEPYDVFICFKEHDKNGDRTPDSVFAQEIYDELTDRGYRVFFSRITLEDKLGTEYEPYIFAALNSARIMLAFGTSAEYYNSVWVKNEWSRFLQLMASGAKKTLIPCYADMDIEDMPKGFSIRQAQNMAKLGWQQDLLRGIEKIIPRKTEPVQEHVIVRESANNPTVDSLLKRAFIFLEDQAWQNANEYCEKVLDIDPENARAYLGKLMAQLRVARKESLGRCANPFDTATDYKKAVRYADSTLKNELEGYIDAINKRNKYQADKAVFDKASLLLAQAKTSQDFKAAADKFSEILHFEHAAELAAKCKEQSELARKAEIYKEATQLFHSFDPEKTLMAKGYFEKIPDYKDAAVLASQCADKAEQLRKRQIKKAAADVWNSPLSNVEQIEKLLALVDENHGWLVVDEAFIGFCA